MIVPHSRAMAVGLAVAVTLAVGACSSGDSGGAASGDDTIRLQVSGEPEETAVYDALAAAFMEQHPGSTIEVVKVAEKPDHLARLSTSFAAGNPPDVFLVNFREFSQYAARGALEPGRSAARGPGARLRRLLHPAARRVRLRRRTSVHAAEHLVARRLLQPRAVQALRGRRTTGLVELGGVPEHRDRHD